MALFKLLLFALAGFILIVDIATTVSAGPPPAWELARRREEMREEARREEEARKREELEEESRKEESRKREEESRGRGEESPSDWRREHQRLPGEKTPPPPLQAKNKYEQYQLDKISPEKFYQAHNPPLPTVYPVQLQCTCEAQIQQLNKTLQSQIRELQTKINKLTQLSQSRQQVFQPIKPLDHLPSKKPPKLVPPSQAKRIVPFPKPAKNHGQDE